MSVSPNADLKNITEKLMIALCVSCNECILNLKPSCLLATLFEPLADHAGGEAQEWMQARDLGQAGARTQVKPETGRARVDTAHVGEKFVSEQTVEAPPGGSSFRSVAESWPRLSEGKILHQ